MFKYRVTFIDYYKVGKRLFIVLRFARINRGVKQNLKMLTELRYSYEFEHEIVHDD